MSDRTEALAHVVQARSELNIASTTLRRRGSMTLEDWRTVVRMARIAADEARRAESIAFAAMRSVMPAPADVQRITEGETDV